MRRTALICAALLLSVAPAFAFAQFTIPGADSALSISLDPAHPGPGTKVTVSLSSSLYDLDTSAISWRANGSLIGSGIGQTSVSLITGTIGQETAVTVDVSGESGSAHAEARIVPTTIDLLWEADTYTPPFYRGRALPSAGASLRLVAIPHFTVGGKKVAANALTYTWRADGQVIGSVSGRGKSSAIIDAPTLYGAEIISVVAAAPDGSVSGEASVRLSDTRPRIILYEDHPLYGVLFDQALGPSPFVGDAEMTFAAIPLFAPVSDLRDRALSYDWRVNQTDVTPSDAAPNEITINATKSNGIAGVQLSVSHAQNYFFNADASWNITFTKAGGGTAASGDPFHAQ